jgi:hypothetical protein
MKKIIFSLTILMIQILLYSCSTAEKRAVKPSEDLTPAANGKAVITEIRELSGNSDINSKGYVEIYFDFIPSKSDDPQKYSGSGCAGYMIKLVYDNRETFHINWVKKWDIKSGNEYPAMCRSVKKNKFSVISYDVFIEPKK